MTSLNNIFQERNGILLTKLFRPTVRKNCSSDRKFFFEITRPIYSNSERSDQFLKQNAFLTFSWRFLRSNILEQLYAIEIGKNYWDSEIFRKS